MRDRVHNKVFLVTGSSGGIGHELAGIILSNGGMLVINGRSESKREHMEAAFSGYRGRFSYEAADVTIAGDCERLIQSAIRRFGRLDGLVLNAGVSSSGVVAELHPKVSAEVIASNLNSAFYLLHYALPHLMKTKGAVVLVSSLAGVHGLPGHAPYSASKMALVALYQSLRAELSGTGVFAGISMVGFTANDPGKTRLAANGNPEPVPARRAFRAASRQATAAIIYRQLVRRRQPFMIHSALGFVVWAIDRLMPRLYQRLIAFIWRRTPF